MENRASVSSSCRGLPACHWRNRPRAARTGDVDPLHARHDGARGLGPGPQSGERHRPIGAQNARQLEQISDVFSSSITALSAAVGGASGGCWQSSSALIGALDERLGVSDDDTLLSYRLHALLRVDEALAGLASLYGMTVDATDPATGSIERQLSAGHVRRRFSAARR